MLRRVALLRAFEVLVIGAGLLTGAISPRSASAQLVFGGSDFNDPYIMCKAWVPGTTEMYASGQAPNVSESADRFRYWARKYGETNGLNLTTDCERFENITPEYRQSFEPGASYTSNSGKLMSLSQALFLPDNWSTTPTPEEEEREEAQKKAKQEKPDSKSVTYYGFCWDQTNFNATSTFFTFNGPPTKSEPIISINPPVSDGTPNYARIAKEYTAARGTDAICRGWTNLEKATDEYTKHKRQFPRLQTVSFTPKMNDPKLAVPTGDDEPETEEAATKPKKSAVQIAAEEAAARRAEREAEFQAKHDEYERLLAEQKKQVEDFKKAQEEVERTKAANQAKADEAAAKFKAEQEAYAESVRHNEAQQEAAKKLMADWDARHGLKAKASTDTDANQCVTQAGTQLNASFKGNTAASIINGCGQPVDVRICLMTSTKGWNCGVSYGVGSQEKWSWSSFDATGPVFVDARVSSSPRPLASPQ